MKVPAWVFIASCSLIHLPTLAQSNETDTSYTNLETVEVLGLNLRDQAPFALSNLYKKDIEKLNLGKELPYLFQDMPSIIVSSDAGAGVGYADMRIRGTDNQRINFTINGIPVNDAESQGSFFVNFPDLISSASSVQVQRGVGSSTNGAGAFGGSVHINNLLQSEKASAQITNSIGSFNTRRHTIKAGTGLLGNGFQFDIRLSKINSDGYIERAYSDLAALQFISSWTSKDDRTQVQFNLFTGKQRTGQAWNGVSEEMLTTNRRYNELGIKEDGSYYDDQSDNYQQDYYQLFLNHQFNAHWKSKIALFLTRGRGFYNEYRIGEDFPTYGITPTDSSWQEISLTRQLWLDNHYYGSVFNLQYDKDNTRIDLGAMYAQYDGKHYGIVTWADKGFPADHRWYNNPAFKTDINVYAKWEQNIDKHWSTFLDVQLRHVSYQLNGYRKNPNVYHDVQYTFFNPKAGISYTQQRHRWYASVALANKEPNRDDFEAAAGQVPSHETLTDWELGYQYQDPQFQLGANLYYMQYKNQLINTGKINDVGAYTRVNVPDSYRRGIEVQAKYKALPWLDINGHLTLSENRIKQFDEFIDDYDLGGQQVISHSNSHIALSPGTIAGLSFTFHPLANTNHKDDLYIKWSNQHIGRQYLDNTSNIDRSIEAYTLSNLQIGYVLPWKKIPKSTLTVSVNNLFNTMYSNKGYTFSYYYHTLQTYNYYFPQAGRHYGVQLQIDL